MLWITFYWVTWLKNIFQIKLLPDSVKLVLQLGVSILHKIKKYLAVGSYYSVCWMSKKWRNFFSFCRLFSFKIKARTCTSRVIDECLFDDFLPCCQNLSHTASKLNITLGIWFYTSIILLLPIIRIKKFLKCALHFHFEFGVLLAMIWSLCS